MNKHTYIDAVFALGHSDFVLRLPHNGALTAAEYNAAYSEVTEKDGGPQNDMAVYSTDPDEFTVSYAEAHAKYEELVGGEALAELRLQRNELLHDTDWTQNVDSPLTAEKQTAFATYRQALRDITNVAQSLDEAVWPQIP